MIPSLTSQVSVSSTVCTTQILHVHVDDMEIDDEVIVTTTTTSAPGKGTCMICLLYTSDAADE